ncbi:MAG: glycosyltransferase, partial [Blastocatellia bacterium]
MPEENLGRRLRIAYLTINDPTDRRSWSGTDYCMARALEKHCGELFLMGPLQPLSQMAGKSIRRVFNLLGRTYLPAHTMSASKILGRMADRKLSETSCDVVFAPAGSSVLAHLQTKLPIVYLSDVTFRLIAGYYPEFSRLLASQGRMADQIEQLAIQKAAQLIYPSSWAARSAIEDYGADPRKVHVVPFGANLEHPPSREQAVRVPPSDRCRLLFVGVNWERKRGGIALETLLEL